MASVKITELTAATALAGTDVLPIVDVGADATKKVSVSDLLRNLPDGTASAPALAFADDQNTGVLSPGNNSLAFATSGTQRLVIDSSGNCGIGTSSPGTKLDVNDGSANCTIRARTGTGFSSFLSLLPNGSGTGVALAANADSSAQLFNQLNSHLAFGTNNSERARIDSSGRLGIGTSSPSQLLDLASTAPNIRLTDTVDGHSEIDGNAASLKFNADKGNAKAGSNISFAVDNTERMRIDSSGNVGIGTTSNYDDSVLEIRKTAGGDGVAIRVTNNTTTDGSQSGIIFTTTTSDFTSAAIAHKRNDNALIFYNGQSSGGGGFANATERMRLDSSGNAMVGTPSANGAGGLTIRPNITEGSPQIVFNRSTTTNTSFCQLFKNAGTDVGSISYTNTTTAFNTSSDYRLKENVVAIADGITRVKQLQPRRFNFIADASKTVDGFLAHEAQAVVPEAVTGTHNEVDDDNNPVYQGIDQSKLMPLLTAALQEAIAKIETLEAKVAALEAQ